MDRLRALLRLLGFLAIIALFFIPVWLCCVTRFESGRWFLLRRFYRWGAGIFGVKVQVKGRIAEARPLLLVSNHCTYLDIPVLGTLLPVGFTPKREIRGWPLIGTLCVLAGCVFIDRQRSKTGENQKNLVKKLQAGAVISLFPEGTTNDGSHVQRFRSSYFSVAEETVHKESLQVQPVTVNYLNRNGESLTRAQMEKVAWYGDAEFVDHLWEYFKTSGVLAQVIFHAPVTIAQFTDRKELAVHCQRQVESAFKAVPE